MNKGRFFIDFKTLTLIWALAWPTMLEQLMQTAVQYIDTAMVGSLGTEATAAVGATTTVGWLIGSSISALGIGFLAFIAKAFGAKDDRLAGNPNQMNIQSMYSDVDLDANNMETEFQASFEDLLWFVNCYLANIGVGDFEGEEVEIIFNRDILINEGEVIDNCQKSSGILSDETIVANHPWVDDPLAELERLKKQKEDEIKEFGDPFSHPANDGNDDFTEETEE
jgi:hypothetical protein